MSGTVISFYDRSLCRSSYNYDADTGVLFVDRDGNLFSYILLYLRASNASEAISQMPKSVRAFRRGCWK